MLPRVLVIGLDGLLPALVFERHGDDFPCLGELMDAGIWGPLRRPEPPDAATAWASLLSGYTAAQLAAPRPRVWDHLGAAGLTAGLVGVPDVTPGTLRGFAAAAFRSPGARGCTWPAEIEAEIEDLLGDYPRDVDLTGAEPAAVLAAVRLSTEQHFALFRHLVRRRGGDFTMLLEPGPARVRRAGRADAKGVAAYYAELDEQVARTLRRVDPAGHVFVVSAGDADGDGLLIYRGPRAPRPGRRAGLRLIDVGPTLVSLLGLPVPADAAGRPMRLE